MKKIIKFNILILVFITFTSFALKNVNISPKATGEGDCVLFSSKEDDKVYGICDKVNLKVLNSTDCRLAFKNLENFCKNKKNYKGPESSYIFDQLLNVGFRKLDAIDGLYEGTFDEIGKTWRNYVEQREENIDGIKPQNILEIFNYFRNPGNGKLFNKYLEVCDDINTILRNLFETSYFTNGKTSFSTYLDNLKFLCVQQVYNRYYKEESYIRAILIKHGNLVLKNQWYNRLIKQFVQDDWPRLLEKFSKFVGYLTRIVKLIGEGAKNCNR